MAIRKKMKNTVIVIGLLFILFLACLFPLLNLPIFDCIAYLLSWFAGQERAEACSPSLTKPDSLETVKLILLIIGVLMAVYTLILADERQEKFSEQVETSQEQVKQFSKQVDNAQAQLFNDRLGRGVELLANDTATLRVTGVRILDDLAKTSDHGQIGLIIKILYDHLKNRGDIRYTENEAGENVPKDRGHRKTRQSVELALKTILTLANTDNISRKDIIFDELDLRGLDISGVTCELPGVIFQNILAQKSNNTENTKFIRTQLKEAIFKNCDFSQTSFHKSNLEGTKFHEKTQLKKARFTETNLTKAQFDRCNMEGAFFTGAIVKEAEFNRQNNLTNVSFRVADLRGANFFSCDLQGCDLEGADLSEANINNIQNLTQDQLNQIIYEQDYPPRNIPEHLNLPADRAYIREGKKRRFVKSDKDWSEQWIDD